MKHGDKVLCHLSRLLLLMALVLVGSAFNSCKSSRNMVEETRTEFHYSGRDSTRVDSILMEGNERSSQGDTTSVSADLHGSIEIKRDTVGRPIKITWTRSSLVWTLSKRDKEAQNWFYGLNAARRSESSGTVDSVNEKTEETTEEISTTISLENIIGPGLLCLALLYLIYLFFTHIVWPWIKQKRSR